MSNQTENEKYPRTKDKKEYKYEAWTSDLGYAYFDTSDEVDEYIGSSRFGALYEIRNPKDNSFYDEFIPF